jgi:hypothetical protein
MLALGVVALASDIDQKEALRRANEIAKQGVSRAAQESIALIQEANRKRNRAEHGCPNCSSAKCYDSCPRVLIRAGGNEVLDFMSRTSPPNRREKEALPPGEPSFKGGSKNGRKRKKPPKSWFQNPFLS